MIVFRSFVHIFLLNGKLHRLSVGFVVFCATFNFWLIDCSTLNQSTFRLSAERLSQGQPTFDFPTINFPYIRAYGRNKSIKDFCYNIIDGISVPLKRFDALPGAGVQAFRNTGASSEGLTPADTLKSPFNGVILPVNAN